MPRCGRLVLLDASWLAYRFHYGQAARNRRDGGERGALAGFAELFAALRRDPDISHLALALDLPQLTFRHQLYPAYKAQRPPMPPELRLQLDALPRLAEACGVATLAAAGYEADDILATMARRAAAAGLQVRLGTRDRDLDQVIQGSVVGWDPVSSPDAEGLRDAAAVQRSRGVGPEQIVDLLTLCGDRGDNVPGVRGIGERTAAKLLGEFSSIAGILASLDKLSPLRRERISAFAASQLELTRRLVTLVEVEGLPELERLRRQDALPAEGVRLLRELGLDAPTRGRPLRPAVSPTEPEQIGLAELPATRAAIAGSQAWAMHWREDALGLAWRSEQGLATAWLNPATAAQLLATNAPPLPPVLVHDAATAGQIPCCRDRRLPSIRGDSWLAARLLDPTAADNLADLAAAVLGIQLRPPALIGAGPAQAEAAQAIVLLEEELQRRMDPALRAWYHGGELPWAELLQQGQGLLLDHQAITAETTQLAHYLAALQLELRRRAGGRCPDLLDQQRWSTLLQQQLGRAPDPSGPDYDRALAAQARPGDAADLLRQARSLTRCLALVEDLSTQAVTTNSLRCWTERDRHLRALHTTIGPLLPDPDLPDWGLAGSLRAPPGQILLSLSLPRLVWRIAAAADLALAPCCSASDEARCLAAILADLPPTSITPAEGRQAGTLLRACLDGRSGLALAEQLGCERPEASGLLARFSARFPALVHYRDSWLERIAADGRHALAPGAACHVGQRRPLRTTALQGRRATLDTLFEGAAADLFKHICTTCAEHLPSDFHPVLVDRHRLVLAGPESARDSAVAACRTACRKAWDLPVEMGLRLGCGQHLQAAFANLVPTT